MFCVQVWLDVWTHSFLSCARNNQANPPSSTNTSMSSVPGPHRGAGAQGE